MIHVILVTLDYGHLRNSNAQLFTVYALKNLYSTAVRKHDLQSTRVRSLTLVCNKFSSWYARIEFVEYDKMKSFYSLYFN